MKGIIFNLLQEVVIQAHGEDVWDDLLEACGLDGVFTSLLRKRVERERSARQQAEALGFPLFGRTKTQGGTGRPRDACSGDAG